MANDVGIILTTEAQSRLSFGPSDGRPVARLRWLVPLDGARPTFIVEYADAGAMGRADLPTAAAMEGAALREIHFPVPLEWDTAPRTVIEAGGRVIYVGAVIRRELLLPDGRMLVWERETGTWSAPPIDLAPVDGRRFVWAAERLAGQPRRGRPPASGKVAGRDRLITELGPIVRTLASAGGAMPTQTMVGRALDLVGDDDALRRTVQRWVRSAGYPDWATFLHDALGDDDFLSLPPRIPAR